LLARAIAAGAVDAVHASGRRLVAADAIEWEPRPNLRLPATLTFG